MFADLRGEIKELIETGYEDRIPKVVAKGFQTWLRQLCNLFRGFAWRGKELEEIEGFTENRINYLKVLYQRFWLEFAGQVLPAIISRVNIVRRAAVENKLTQKEVESMTAKIKSDGFNAVIILPEQDNEKEPLVS